MVESFAEAALPLVVRGNAERYRDRVAIVDGDRTLTFHEFDQAMMGSVRAMMALGLGNRRWRGGLGAQFSRLADRGDGDTGRRGRAAGQQQAARR